MEISVLMSVYNETGYEIKESIESILSQSFSNFEFIIINDNPQREDLKMILNRYKKLDNRIVLLSNEYNIGLAMSLNKAAEIARTDVYARMDADDISEPNRFELQFEIIKKEPYDLVFSNYNYIDENSMPIFNENDKHYSPEDIKRLLPYSSPIHHPTVMMTREIFERAGGYRNFPCAQDRDLWLRIWEAGGRFFMLDKKLLKYRIRSNGISATKKYQQKLTIDYIQDLFVQRLKNGVDNYSLKAYHKYINENGVNDLVKVAEMQKYTNILSKAKRLRRKKKYVMNTILRTEVFICSPIFRKSYLKRIIIKRAIQFYKKGANSGSSNDNK